MGKKELNTFETGFESDETPVAVTGPSHPVSGVHSTTERGVHGDLIAPPARAMGDFDTLPPPPGTFPSMPVPQAPRMPALRSFSANTSGAALHETPKARGDYQQTIPTPLPPAMRTPRPNAADERADTAELRVVRNPSAVLLSVSPMAISQPPRANVPMFTDVAAMPAASKGNKGASLLFLVATFAAALSVVGACAFFLTRQVLHFNTERAYVNEESAHSSDNRGASETAPVRTAIETSVDTTVKPDTLKPDTAKVLPKVETQNSLGALSPVDSAANPQRGVLRLPKSVMHHRTYIDGKQWVSTKMTVDVPCGTHTVKIGSTGKENTYDVPCGGSIDVQ